MKNDKAPRSKNGVMEMWDFVDVLHDYIISGDKIQTVMNRHKLAVSVFYSTYNFYFKELGLRDTSIILRLMLEKESKKVKALKRDNDLLQMENEKLRSAVEYHESQVEPYEYFTKKKITPFWLRVFGK